MTHLRQPFTFADATSLVADHLGWATCAKIVGRSQRTVRLWSEPDCATTPTMRQALQLDAAFRVAGGAGTPFLDAYRHKLDAAIGQQTACTIALAEEAGRAALEMGEAVAASITLTLPGATPRDHVRALAEAQDAQTAIGALTRRLSSFLPSKLSLAAGKAGGHYQ